VAPSSSRSRSWRLAAVVGVVGVGLALFGVRGELTGATRTASGAAAPAPSTPPARELSGALRATGHALAMAEANAARCPAPGHPGRLSCVEAVDRQLQAAWASLAGQVRALVVPAAAQELRAELLADLGQLRHDLGQLTRSRSVQAYDTLLGTDGAESLGPAAGRAADALLAQLGTAPPRAPHRRGD
jgi:hypothetical protein